MASNDSCDDEESSNVIPEQGSNTVEDLMAATKNATTATSSAAASRTSTTERILESIMRVSLAGFGGALAGLSLSRQRTAAAAARVRAGAPPVRLHAASTTTSLPMNWALCCVGFCTLIEVSRWTSPTSVVTSSKPIQTIGDYTIGGAAAGAAFRGMQVMSAHQTTPMTSSKRRAAIVATRPNVLSGLASGVILGLMAGIVQCAADVGEEMMKEEQNRQQQPKPSVDRMRSAQPNDNT